jgi:hypothetical protein
MFTGLIADLGRVAELDTDADGARLRIATSLAGDVREGDSIAVNGVCLTATEVDAEGFSTEAMPETLQRSSLGTLDEGDAVNLEPPTVSAATSSRAMSTAPARCARSCPTGSRASSRSTPTRHWRATWSRRGRSRSTASA